MTKTDTMLRIGWSNKWYGFL